MSQTWSNDSVRISHAHKYYNKGRQNEIHVLNDVDLTLPASGMVAIFGQSGCGKTTLLNAVGGLDRIQSGSISLFGSALESDTDRLRNKYTGFIFQNYNLNVNETVLENVADALLLCGMTDKEEIRTRCLTALKCVEMDKYRDRTPDTLSGGQQQRVAIARAIVKSPAVILADEPTGNLDENNTVMVMDILKEISRTRLVLLVTHEANLVDYYCDKVIEMSDGQIVGVRENNNADGYVKRNKNDIWLGELEKREESVPGLSVTCYGDIPANKPVRVRLISEGGRLYLRCDTPGVRVLDDSSEITLREGSFEEVNKKTDAQEKHTTHIDMSALTPIEGHDYGRLFRFKGAVNLAWRENYSKKKKKGNKFFRVCLFVLAFVMVIMTSVMSVEIRQYADAMDAHDENLFYIPLEVGDDGKAVFDYNALLADAVGENGIDAVQLVRGTEQQSLLFDTAQFMTVQAPKLSASAVILPVSQLGNADVVCGTADCAAGGMIITTAFADDLLESSKVSYINDYNDLVGLVKGKPLYQYTVFDEAPSDAPGGKFHIAGIIRSDERLVYVNNLDCARSVFQNLNVDVDVNPQSAQPGYAGTINPGEMVIMADDYNADKFKAGEVVTLLGRKFTVKEITSRLTDLSGYTAFYEAKTGKKLPTFAEYVQQKNVPEEEEARLHAFSEWLFSVCYSQMPGYIKSMESWYITDYEYGAGYMSDLAAFAYLLLADGSHGIDMCDPLTLEYRDIYSCEDLLNRAYWAWMLRSPDGTWPTNETLENKLAVECNHFVYLYKVNSDSYWDGLSRLLNQSERSSVKTCLICDEDYILLSRSAGASDDRIADQRMFKKETYDWMEEESYYTWMRIHADNPATAEAYLTGAFGDLVKTPDDIFEQSVSNVKTAVLTAVVSVSVVLAFMCLSVYFIMRSSFMSRVKEVGIHRAIGVTRKNMIFRFFIETVMLTLMTVGIGYVLAWAVVTYMQGGVLLSTMLYFPLWIALPELIIILAVCFVFGLLPAFALLRRTPSEILSKYDI